MGWIIVQGEEKKNKIKTAFIQPAYREYRRMLFDRFDRHFNTNFIFREGQIPPRYQPSGSRAVLFGHQSKNKRDEGNSFYLVKQYLALLLFLIRSEYSVVITTTALSPETVIALIVSKIKRYKCVLWIEEWFMPKPNSLILRFRLSLIVSLQKLVLRSVNAIVAEGTPHCRYALTLGISPEKVFISNHCSNDYSNYPNKSLRKKLNINNGVVVLYLGRITEYKGLDVLLRAFSKIERNRNDTYLLICGDGEYRPFCEHLAKNLKLKHSIFLGYVSEEEIASCYETADVFVLPSCARSHESILSRAFSGRSHIEGWGLVINEAMSMGKSIVTTDVTGAAEDLVKNGVNGYVVRNEDVNELYLALENIVKDRELRENMGQNSRKIFEKFNDFDKMFEGFRKAITYALK